MPELSDQWAAASTYEHFMGRWSRILAREFLGWLNAPPRQHWLELGCGTGALTTAIRTSEEPASVTACDPAPAFLDFARQNTADSRVSFVLAGADDFPMRAGGYDQITSALALNFFPDVAAALDRAQRALRSGGQVSACVWDYAGGMQFLRYFWDSARAIDADAQRLDEGVRFPLCTPEKLREVFDAAGLDDVAIRPIDIRTDFPGFADYWAPFLGGTGPAPAFVASLAAERRALLHAELERRVPVDADGRIRLLARAWAVKGSRHG